MSKIVMKRKSLIRVLRIAALSIFFLGSTAALEANHYGAGVRFFMH
jgi:hypothetical protein